VILATTGCDLISGPGTLTGTVTYAKDPTQPLTDPQNAGVPAPGIKVLIYGTDRQNAPGQAVYVEQRMPTKELSTDEQGRYTTELPSGHYVVRLEPDPKLYHGLADVGPARITTVDFIINRPSSGSPPTPSPYPAPGQ
jgi:hypothetical protein